MLYFEEHNPAHYHWLMVDNSNDSIYAFQRNVGDDTLVFVFNMTTNFYESFAIPLMQMGTYEEIFNSDKDNVLLEFTATCDLKNQYIMNEYEKKIIVDYPLRKFREDRYSKELKTFQSHVPLIDRVLQAILLSQYRLKLFQDNKKTIKPVILFKSDKIESVFNR